VIAFAAALRGHKEELINLETITMQHMEIHMELFVVSYF
jgi:hypothetical protein